MRFHSNIPINEIINISIFQFQLILAQFSVLFKGLISKRTFMVSVTFFESILTSVIVIFISCCINRCFENKAFRKTVTVHRTVCFSTAIASFDGRCLWILNNVRIMFPDDIIRVRHIMVT